MPHPLLFSLGTPALFPFSVFAMNNTYRIVSRAPSHSEARPCWTDRTSATPYSHAVWVQSIAKGFEGEWIFCGFASTEKRAQALARKEGGVIVQTEVTAL